MEVQFTPELEQKLNTLAALSGRPADDVVRDAVAGMVEDLAGTGEMLEHRYDEIKSGKVNLVSGDEVFARLRAKSEAFRQKPRA